MVIRVHLWPTPLCVNQPTINTLPAGFPIMRQHWGKLLFMHWRIDANLLRPLIPSQLKIDTFDGSAWIGVIPFTMWGIRASFLPPIPGTSAFHELNVRTYVTLNGEPGVWFFSLDAANSLAGLGRAEVLQPPLLQRAHVAPTGRLRRLRTPQPDKTNAAHPRSLRLGGSSATSSPSRSPLARVFSNRAVLPLRSAS